MTQYPRRSKASPQATIPSLEAIRKERAERSFYEFVKQAWHVVEPATEFVDGEHIRLICETLQRTGPGGIQALVINIPPRCMKSLLTCVFFPAWKWIIAPGTRFLYSSYSLQLATRDSIKCRRLIESPWYQERWRDRYKLATDQNSKSRYENTKGGHRVICSPDSSTTGEGGDYIIVDDPVNVTDALSDSEREKVVEWWDTSMSTRVNDPATATRIIIGQRVHVEDLSGHCLQTGNYFHLCLPAEYEVKDYNDQPKLISDFRTIEGQLLWPERLSQEFLDGQKAALGSYSYAGQYQQRPTPPGGVIIHTDWLRYYEHLPEKLDTLIQSWDLTFTNSKTSDFVVGQVWGRAGANFYLIDQVRGRFDFPETIKQIKALSVRYPQATIKLIEKAANGFAAIATLQNEVPGLIAVPATKSKEARLIAVAPLFESGNVYLPQGTAFLDAYTQELTAFPSAPHDDQVDATTQALQRLSTSSRTSFNVFSYI